MSPPGTDFPFSIEDTAANGLLSVALDSAPIGLIVLDASCRVRLVTGVAAALLGLPSVQLVEGLTIGEVVRAYPHLAQAGALAHLPSACAPSPGEAEESDITVTLARPTGPATIHIDIRPAGRLGWVLSVEDVTAARQTQDWLLEHASSDPVTGRWNRQHFMLMLQDRLAMGEGAAHREDPALLMIGLQRLKQVNQGLGLGAGDTLLRLVGQRLAAALGDQDLLGRFAGDKFAVFVSPHASTQAAGAGGALAALVEDLSASLSEAYFVDGQAVTLGAHIGIARPGLHGDTGESLVTNAMLALEDTTVPGAAPVRFFEPALTERAAMRRALEADLRLALGRREFELHYQPQVDVHRGHVTGLEALIRWRSPTRGLVPPVEFIALAEQIGLINDIGDWVLREACRQASSWSADIRIAVNASPLQFETGHFAQSVADALAETQLPASRPEIEITESLLLRDTGTVMATLAALHALGVRLVLDDFGTGYASLSQLSRFRFDKIKIDRSFVSPVDADIENSAIVRSIAALGRSLGIPTTAEGVETAKQLEQIKADGCTCVQGYYFSRPVPSADVSGLLDRLHTRQVFAAA